jgi:hypothetical protein
MEKEIGLLHKLLVREHHYKHLPGGKKGRKKRRKKIPKKFIKPVGIHF